MQDIIKEESRSSETLIEDTDEIMTAHMSHDDKLSESPCQSSLFSP